MKVHGNEIKTGNIIAHQGALWTVVKTQHTQPGKGGAYMQAELRCLRTGTKLNERFRSSESVEKVRLEEQTYQYLFQADSTLTLMDQETFEQITVPLALLGESAVFLQDDMVLNLWRHEGECVRVMLPDTVTLTVTEADPVVKGQSASSSYKPARLENGVRVLVPPHIGVGMKVVVNTQDSTYVEKG